jgi:hypothetical protein
VPKNIIDDDAAFEWVKFMHQLNGNEIQFTLSCQKLKDVNENLLKNSFYCAAMLCAPLDDEESIEIKQYPLMF